MTDRFKLRKKIGGGYCEPYNHLEAVMRMHLRHLTEKFEEALIKTIKERLSYLGHEFYNEEGFITFCKARVYRIHVGGNLYEVRLDYVSALKPGMLLVHYDTSITIEPEFGDYKNPALSAKITIG